eukprot:GCRY01003543.1.p1 GENE.GCRY01003543.1~~GCRY01003543.1.p1  ORF type:complete len:113 (+),score=1.75 GCRY01003543.1:109-447(+)
MYIASWEEFFEKSQELYLRSPAETRMTMKYRHVDAKLVLKVTNNVVCYMYRTDQQQDLKKLEKFTMFYIQHMSHKPDVHHTLPSIIDEKTEDTQSSKPSKPAQNKRRRNKGK